jgi:hypothetical protein
MLGQAGAPNKTRACQESDRTAVSLSRRFYIKLISFIDFMLSSLLPSQLKEGPDAADTDRHRPGGGR